MNPQPRLFHACQNRGRRRPLAGDMAPRRHDFVPCANRALRGVCTYCHRSEEQHWPLWLRVWTFAGRWVRGEAV